MTTKIITISREFGSGGRFIGEMLAKELGFSFYDKELIARVAEKTGFSEKFIENRREYAPKNSIFSYSFVGRCADYILEDYDNLLRVFVYADMETKIKRISKLYDLTEQKAKEKIVKKEKSRKTFYNYYTDRTWGSVSSYDLCINTGYTGIDGAVELIKKSLEAKI